MFHLRKNYYFKKGLENSKPSAEFRVWELPSIHTVPQSVKAIYTWGLSKSFLRKVDFLSTFIHTLFWNLYETTWALKKSGIFERTRFIFLAWFGGTYFFWWTNVLNSPFRLACCWCSALFHWKYENNRCPLALWHSAASKYARIIEIRSIGCYVLIYRNLT